MHAPSPLLLLALAASPGPLFGQATADQARLMFTVGVGMNSGGGVLWSVGRQPFITNGETDTLALSRQFRRSLNVVFSGTYFPGPNLGFRGEAMLIGLGTKDACRIVAAGGSRETSELCGSLNQAERSATAASISVGLVYRAWSTSVVHPYLTAHGGVVISQQSFLKMTGEVVPDTNNPAVVADLTLYDDPDSDKLHPYLGLGGGVVAVIASGYQMRFELRDNYVRVPAVAGPTLRQNLEPRRTTVGKHLLSFSVGFDVVLEKKRGRRY